MYSAKRSHIPAVFSLMTCMTFKVVHLHWQHLLFKFHAFFTVNRIRVFLGEKNSSNRIQFLIFYPHFLKSNLAWFFFFFGIRVYVFRNFFLMFVIRLPVSRFRSSNVLLSIGVVMRYYILKNYNQKIGCLCLASLRHGHRLKGPDLYPFPFVSSKILELVKFKEK